MAYKSEITKMGGAAALDQEVESGKKLIAQAINDKGGTASEDESLSELADDVLGIPVNVQVEDAANLAFPESISWNILKEAYAQQRVGYASWIVAEFFKGYDTIPLSGADAFYTCDGDFYTEATTHTWHDDEYNKVNRFVVYYFVGDNVPFSVTQESVCPRSMAVMGKFGSINIASAGRIRQIYNGGEINDISFASTNPWSEEVLLAGVAEHNSGYILNGNSVVQMFAIDIEVLNGGSLIYATQTVNVTAISLPSLKKITAGCLFYNYTADAFNQLNTLSLPSLEKINVQYGLADRYLGAVRYMQNTRKLLMPKLVKTTGQIISAAPGYGYGQNLILIEIGDGYNGNLDLRMWYAQNAIKDTDNSLVDEGETFANNREKFLYNFEHYIVDKLADNSTTGLSYTITLYSSVYNIVSATQSITDKLTAKHWNLASA